MADYVTKIRTMEGDKQIDYNALANKPAAALPLDGGTMKGPVVLASNPSNDMEAVTKKYVDDSFKAHIESELDAMKGYLKINATYSSSGEYAKDVYFRGVPGANESLMKTNSYGVFFSEVPLGSYTLVFRPIIGEQLIPDKPITVSAGKLTEVNISINKSNGGLVHITESNDYLVGQDAASVSFFGIGGGGSGGISVREANTNRGFAHAASGGGSGFVATANIDLFALRGNFLRIDIGAGGAGAATRSNTGVDATSDGNKGGSTTITRHDGVVVLNAAGGGAGVGKYTKYNATSLAGSVTATGGGGACPGASVTAARIVDTTTSPYTETEKTTFVTDNIEGVYVFDNENYPRIGGGGYAQGSTIMSDNTVYTSIYGVGCNADGSTIDGTGAGSGAFVDVNAANENASTYSGGSGCVFIK